MLQVPLCGPIAEKPRVVVIATTLVLKHWFVHLHFYLQTEMSSYILLHVAWTCFSTSKPLSRRTGSYKLQSWSVPLMLISEPAELHNTGAWCITNTVPCGSVMQALLFPFLSCAVAFQVRALIFACIPRKGLDWSAWCSRCESRRTSQSVCPEPAVLSFEVPRSNRMSCND